MAVMMPREKWTDERLDDLSKKVDDGFAGTEAVIADTKAEMRESFARVDAEIGQLRSEMNERFNSVDARFEALNRNLFMGMVAVIVALIGSNAF